MTSKIRFPSLEWYRSCLREPFLGGQPDLLGIHRLFNNRKPSATDPKLIDHDSDADDILEEVDRLMGKMEVNLVTDIEEVFLEDALLRLEGMKNDAEACVKLFKSWKRRYEGEDDAALMQYRNRSLGTLEKVITSLMDYLITLSATSSGKRRYSEPIGSPLWTRSQRSESNSPGIPCTWCPSLSSLPSLHLTPSSQDRGTRIRR